MQIANAEALCKALRSERPSDCFCIDCGADRPEWASVSNGVLMCLNCAGQHRSLGVHVSFVRSVAMDAWKPEHLKMLQIGGNQRFQQMLEESGTSKLPLAAKYCTPAAEAYRAALKAAVSPAPAPAPVPVQAPLAQPSESRPQLQATASPAATSGLSTAAAATSAAAKPKINIWSDELWE
mmetsp:Transcript_6199/g.13683  ORF Transcript_6199/g.13683 Transcript_6199/m.13683 type:complete len:180 (-) Transcript_6199:85-624(-)